MCFAEPGQVVSTDGSMARLAADNGESDVSLAVLIARGEHIEPGDWVMAALGLAIERIDGDDARRMLREHRRMRAPGDVADLGPKGIGAHVR